MANWHLVTAYDERAAEWLAGHGYKHPAALSGNRLPTLAEIESAVHELGIGLDALLIDGVSTTDSFTVRGDLVAELRLIRLLSLRSGQLWVYPDCGSPAIVVDSTTNPEVVAAEWLRSLDSSDPWAAFLGTTTDDEQSAAADRGNGN
jgi:hypothetical protein